MRVCLKRFEWSSINHNHKYSDPQSNDGFSVCLLSPYNLKSFTLLIKFSRKKIFTLISDYFQLLKVHF